MKRYPLYIYCLLFPWLVAACSHKQYIQQHTYRLYTVTGSSSADTGLTRMLQPYKRIVDSQMNVVIGNADSTLTKDQPECTLGNFVADAIYEKAKTTDPAVDAAIYNYGGLRVPYISAGTITVGKIYELAPFDNTLTIIAIPGSILQQLCNHMAAWKGWPASHISYIIKDNTATAILINNQPIDPNKTYKIAANDYLAKGGDNCSLLVPLENSNTNIMLRDILITYIQQLAKQGKPLHPYIDKRIVYAE